MDKQSTAGHTEETQRGLVNNSAADQQECIHCVVRLSLLDNIILSPLPPWCPGLPPVPPRVCAGVCAGGGESLSGCWPRLAGLAEECSTGRLVCRGRPLLCLVLLIVTTFLLPLSHWPLCNRPCLGLVLSNLSLSVVAILYSLHVNNREPMLTYQRFLPWS